MTTTKMKMVLSLLAVAAMVGCNPSSSTTDTGASTSDAGTSDTGASTHDTGSIVLTDTGTIELTDTGPRTDAPMVSTDPCAEDEDPITTLGCNGFASSTPAANTPGGACTGGGEAMLAGTCTGADVICDADVEMVGFCMPTCTPGETYVSTGGCPTGFRCFDFGDEAICYQDCDATHACPSDQECDPDGSCVALGSKEG